MSVEQPLTQRDYLTVEDIEAAVRQAKTVDPRVKTHLIDGKPQFLLRARPLTQGQRETLRAKFGIETYTDAELVEKLGYQPEMLEL